MANPNVFLQWAEPRKFAADYTAEMDAADARKAQNALQALTMQATHSKMAQEVADRQRAEGVRNKLAALLQSSGGDEEKMIGAALRDPDLYGWGRDQETARLERQGKIATTKKNEAEAAQKAAEEARKKRQEQIQAMATAETPQQAIEMLSSLDAIPMAERTRLIRQMQAITDPQKFTLAKALIVYGLATPEQQAQGMLPKYTDGGGQLVQTNPLAGQGAIQKTQTFADRTAAGNLALSRERLQFDKDQGARPEWDPTNQVFVDRKGQKVTPGPTGAGGKPLTDAQSKALLFGSRAAESHKVLDKMEALGVTQPGRLKRAAETTGEIVGLGTSFGDVLGSTAGTLTNWTQSKEQQQVEQAQRDFINALMRRESGAVISASEFDNARKQYFPQPGDSPEVMAQKKANRETAIRGIMAEVPEGRRALPEVPGLREPAPPPMPGVDTSAGVPQDIADIMRKWGPKK